MAGDDIISQLSSIEGNNFCADCGTRSPRWASVNIGVLLCIKCSGIHRTLGVHLSQVKSLTLDNLKHEWIDSLMNIGNDVANKYYLNRLPPNISRYYLCSTPSDMEVWIRNKYEKKIYVMENVDEPHVLLAKGLNPRDVLMGGNYDVNNKQYVEPNLRESFDYYNKNHRQPPPQRSQPVYNNKFNNNQDFNPFGIDMNVSASNTSTQWNNDDFWNYDKFKDEQSNNDQHHHNTYNITDPDELRDAKINAAKHSIAKLFQTPTQIGFKSSSYQQTKPNCVTDNTLDFNLSDIKNKLRDNIN